MECLQQLLEDSSVVGEAERPAAWLPSTRQLLINNESLTDTLLTAIAIAMDISIVSAVQGEQVHAGKPVGAAGSADDREQILGCHDGTVCAERVRKLRNKLQETGENLQQQQQQEEGQSPDCVALVEAAEKELQHEHGLLLVQLALSLYHSGQRTAGGKHLLPSMLKAAGHAGQVSGALLMIRAACLYTLSVQHLTSKADSERDKDFLALQLGGPIACDLSPPSSPAAPSAAGGIDDALAFLFNSLVPSSEDRNLAVGNMLREMTGVLFTEPAAYLQPLGSSGAQGTSISSAASGAGSTSPTGLHSVTGKDGRVSLAGVMAAALRPERVPHLAALHGGLQKQGASYLGEMRDTSKYAEGDPVYSMFLSTMYQEMPELIYRKKQSQEEQTEAKRQLVAATEEMLAEVEQLEGKGLQGSGGRTPRQQRTSRAKAQGQGQGSKTLQGECQLQ
jgi:hypothetical protein